MNREVFHLGKPNVIPIKNDVRFIQFAKKKCKSVELQFCTLDYLQVCAFTNHAMRGALSINNKPRIVNHIDFQIEIINFRF